VQPFPQKAPEIYLYHQIAATVLIDAASLGGIPKNFKVLRQMIPVCRPRDDDRRPSVERRLLAALGAVPQARRTSACIWRNFLLPNYGILGDLKKNLPILPINRWRRECVAPA